MQFNNEVVQFLPQPIEGERKSPVFFYENKVFRAILEKDASSFREVFSSGLLNTLSQFDLMPKTQISDFSLDGYAFLIEQELITWIIQPQEWTFSMLKEAARSILTINKICLEYGFETSDCHGFNVLFDGVKPQFVDIGSFIRKNNALYWVALDEFIRCYLYPLKLWSEGEFYLANRVISETYWNRFSPESTAYRKDFQYLLKKPTDFDELLTLVLSFTAKKYDSAWGNYHAHINKENWRFDKIANLVKKMDIQTAHDIAGNAGEFSRYIIEHTPIKKVLCSDKDMNAIDIAFKFNGESPLFEKKISSALLNVMSPIHSEENLTVYERLKSDAIFVLALTHHLILSAKSPLSIILNKLEKYTTKYAFIEFMPYAHLTSERYIEPELTYYSEKWFEQEFKKVFKLMAIERLELNRILFIGHKINEQIDVIGNKGVSNTAEVIYTPCLIFLKCKEDIQVLESVKKLLWKNLSIVIIENALPIFETEIKGLETISENIEIFHMREECLSTFYSVMDDFFDRWDAGIIIQNGFFVEPSFFQFCEELLEHYALDNTVLHLSGANFFNNNFNACGSYFFTQSFFGGAFATWKRSWLEFKQFTAHQLLDLPSKNERYISYYCLTAKEQWLYQWTLFGMHKDYRAIQPKLNLVKFSRKNEETFKYYHALSRVPMVFPLIHPQGKELNKKYDTTLNADFFNPLLPFQQDKLTASSVAVRIIPGQNHLQVSVNEVVSIKINLTNNGLQPLSSLQPFPVHLSYHLFDVHGNCLEYDGRRTSLTSKELIDIGGLQVPHYLFLFENEQRDFLVDFIAPATPGSYILKITLVQEQCCWFDAISYENLAEIEVNVV